MGSNEEAHDVISPSLFTLPRPQKNIISSWPAPVFLWAGWATVPIRGPEAIVHWGAAGHEQIHGLREPSSGAPYFGNRVRAAIADGTL